MKKIFIIMVALIGFTISANAQKKIYKVTITTRITYEYYDDQGQSVGTTSASGTPWSTEICTDTPHKAREEAMNECSTACQRSSRKNEGKRPYGGRSYQCFSTREPIDAQVTDTGRSC